MGLFGKRERAAQNLTSNGSAPAADRHDVPQARDRAEGPWDVNKAPEAPRVDLGSLHIPQLPGLGIALEMNRASQVITGVTLTQGSSTVQVHAFAAPRSETLWDSVRASLGQSLQSQGATTELREATFGTELWARVPVTTAQGPRTYRPMRFVGVDGPRWLLRAIISGDALTNEQARAEVEALIRGIVVDRGSSPMVPREVLPLRAPQDAVSPAPPASRPDPLDPGPTIAEVR